MLQAVKRRICIIIFSPKRRLVIAPYQGGGMSEKGCKKVCSALAEEEKTAGEKNSKERRVAFQKSHPYHFVRTHHTWMHHSHIRTHWQRVNKKSGKTRRSSQEESACGLAVQRMHAKGQELVKGDIVHGLDQVYAQGRILFVDKINAGITVFFAPC